MTKGGKENRFGMFIFTDEQVERTAAGDHSAAWEFIQDNFRFLIGWAKKFIRSKLYFLPAGFVEAEEMLDQIYVDFAFYEMTSQKSLARSIYRSFIGITCGGLLRNGRTYGRQNKEIRLETPVSVSERGGDVSEGETLGDLLPSREPTPLQALEQAEHAQELMPRFFREIGKIFNQDGGATVGELLAFAAGGEAQDAFRDVIEEVFFGYTFEEVKRNATRTA